jgi:hypothetical protein
MDRQTFGRSSAKNRSKGQAPPTGATTFGYKTKQHSRNTFQSHNTVNQPTPTNSFKSDNNYNLSNTGQSEHSPTRPYVNLKNSCLVLALGAIEAREARTGAIIVVADTTAGAITPGFIAITIQRIGTSWAFLKVTSRTSVALVTEAAHLLHGIPGRRVSSGGF